MAWQLGEFNVFATCMQTVTTISLIGVDILKSWLLQPDTKKNKLMLA